MCHGYDAGVCARRLVDFHLGHKCEYVIYLRSILTKTTVFILWRFLSSLIHLPSSLHLCFIYIDEYFTFFNPFIVLYKSMTIVEQYLV